MAFAVTHLVDTVFGNKRVSVQQVTPDSAEGTVATKLANIDFALVSQRKLVTSAGVNYVVNKGTTGTTINGTIGFSGCVANSIMYVVSFGG